MNCPKYNSTAVSQTILHFMYFGKPGKDMNDAHCEECGHKGKAWEFGADEIAPLKGTEKWTDEEIRQFEEDLVNGNVPFGEEIGRAVYNEEALKRIEFRR